MCPVHGGFIIPPQHGTRMKKEEAFYALTLQITENFAHAGFRAVESFLSPGKQLLRQLNQVFHPRV